VKEVFSREKIVETAKSIPPGLSHLRFKDLAKKTT
jgi:hypothetical protein